MMNRKTTRTLLKYRKRPEPHRVVPLASLNRTEAKSERANMTSIVDNSGNVAHNPTWKPLRAKTAPIDSAIILLVDSIIDLDFLPEE